MVGYHPPELHTGLRVALALVVLAVVVYSFVIVHQLLLGLLFVILLAFVYLAWRFLVAIESIADALQRSSRDGGRKP